MALLSRARQLLGRLLAGRAGGRIVYTAREAEWAEKLIDGLAASPASGLEARVEALRRRLEELRGRLRGVEE